MSDIDDLHREAARVHRILRAVWEEHHGDVADMEWALKYMPIFMDMAVAVIADRNTELAKEYMAKYHALFKP